jgi:hypothetical protein
MVESGAHDRVVEDAAVIRTTALPVALCLALASPAANAQPEDTLEVVETRAPMEIVLIDADFLRPEDPSTSIFGANTQFLEGETILIELALVEPIGSDELDALRAGGETYFWCEEAVLYLANGHHVAMAEGCMPAEAAP